MKLQQLVRNLAAIMLTWEANQGSWPVSLPFLCLLHKQGFSPAWWATSQLSQAFCFLCHFSCLVKCFLHSAPNFSMGGLWPYADLQQADLSKANLTKFHRQNAVFVSGVIPSCHYRVSFSSVLYLHMWSVMIVLWSLLFCNNVKTIVSQKLNKYLITGWNDKFNSVILITVCCRSSS